MSDNKVLNNDSVVRDYILTSKPLTMFQKKKNDMKDGSYWYTLGFSDGSNVLTLNSGKAADGMQLGKTYELHLYLDYSAGLKLKLADYKEIK